LLTPAGCEGVLALELPHLSGETPSVRPIATIVAAQLAQLIGGERSQADRMDPAEVDIDPLRDSPPLHPRPSPSAHTAAR
jgi:hypothetical protein